jgi:uncharacterized protein YecT (DUF1311 family)
MRQLFFLIVFGMTIPSCFAQTQSEMNKDAYNKYQKADRSLNATYQSILANYKADTAFTRNLKAAQRLWVQFRDAEMKARYPDREPGYYGSIQPMCWSLYLAELTEERERKLKIWLTGIDEGDACAGTIKSKD